MEWNDHISRMTSTRVVKIARDKAPNNKRNNGKEKTLPVLGNWLGIG